MPRLLRARKDFRHGLVVPRLAGKAVNHPHAPRRRQARRMFQRQSPRRTGRFIRAQAEVLFALRRKRAGKADARIRHGGDKSIQRTSALHVRRAQLAERRSEQPKRRPVADCRLIQMRLRISQPLLKSIQRVRPSAQQLALLEQRLPLGENLFPQAGKVVVFKMGHNILHGKIRLPVFLEREQQNQLIFVVIPRAVFALFRGDHAFLFIKAQRLRGQPQQPRNLADFIKRHGFRPSPRSRICSAAARSKSAIAAPTVSIITSTGLGPRPSEKH